MRNISSIVFLLALLSGCATAYQQQSFSGGYSETQLGENIFQVSFRGNGYTRRERASDFSLLRSAEVALEHGFRYFVIVESEKGSKLGTYTTPTTSYTTGSAYASGNYAYGNATTTTYGGQTYLISKPRATNTILCFKDKPETGGLVFDAQFVSNSIRQKYQLNK
jgi:uncharacterized protein YceK